MRRLAIAGGLALLSACHMEPAFADCMVLPADKVAALNWGKAERFEGGEARLLMQGVMAVAAQSGPLTDLQTYATPPADTLFAQPVGDVVLLIRVVGQKVCGDDPISLETFEGAKLRALPRAG
jgi:hypothetical protein